VFPRCGLAISAVSIFGNVLDWCRDAARGSLVGSSKATQSVVAAHLGGPTCARRFLRIPEPLKL
jgi:hypothetical protein